MRSYQQVRRKQHTGTTAAREVAAFFTRLGNASGSPHPRLRAVTGSSQFNIEGAGRWRVAVEDGVITVSETGSTTASADAVVTATAEDMVRVLRREGYLNAYCASLQELLTVRRGDPALMLLLLDVFSFGHVGAETR